MLAVDGDIDGTPAVDHDVLAALHALDGTGEALASLIRLYLSDSEDRVRRLVAAAAVDDAAAVREHAHAIKGASSTFGATHLVSLATEVEDTSATGRTPDQSTVRLLALEAARVMSALERTLDARP